MAPATKKSSAASTGNASPTIRPPYLQMISEAITSLKDRTGSSQPAIAKFIEEEYKTSLPPNFKKIISVQLKKCVKSEKLIKIKNSYKVSAPEKAKLVENSDKETEKKKKDAKEAARGTPEKKCKGPKKVITQKAVEKAAKTKRLSQVKTPEGLKKKSKVQNLKSSAKGGGKLKKLSQVNTPDALKKTKVNSKSSKLSNKKANC